MKFNNRKKPFLIAEIGINHNGDIKIAKEMIKEAKRIQSKMANDKKNNDSKINLISTF